MNRLSTSTILPPREWGPPSPPPQRSPAFSARLDKFRQKPEALDEDELNDLVDDCLSEGDEDALRSILPHVQELLIRPVADERAWRTLLSAMPEPCSMSGLRLNHITFSPDTAPLLRQAISRMPELKFLCFEDCEWDLAPDELPPLSLPNLQEFVVKRTKDAFALCALFLWASQPTGVALVSNPGMTEEHHAALAKLFSAQAKAGLRHLELRGLLRDECLNKDFDSQDRALATMLAHYTGLLEEKTTTLRSLDVSGNPFGPLACTILHQALSANDRPMHLWLDGCWNWGDGHDHWDYLGELFKLPRFLSISLRQNGFSAQAKALFVALAENKGLQALDLRDASMATSIWADLAFGLRSMKLTTLGLPNLDDDLFGLFIDSMQTNEWLRTVRVPDIERERAWLTSDMFDDSHRKYLAFMACVHRNWLNWQGSIDSVKNGMAQVLAHLGSFKDQGPRSVVPDDVARYAAWWALQMNGAQTRAVSALNKLALPKD